MKPTISSDTGMLIKSTTILAELPANYPFSPPRVIFKDKIAHPDIDSDGVYIGKMCEDWAPALSLAAYVSCVQHDLFFAARACLIAQQPDHPWRTTMMKLYRASLV